MIARISRNEDRAWSVVDFDLHRVSAGFFQPVFGPRRLEATWAK
jgi:hypothetical protein